MDETDIDVQLESIMKRLYKNPFTNFFIFYQVLTLLKKLHKSYEAKKEKSAPSAPK